MLQPHEMAIGNKVVGLSGGSYSWTKKDTFWIIVKVHYSYEQITLMPCPGTKAGGEIRFQTWEQAKTAYWAKIHSYLKTYDYCDGFGVYKVHPRYFQFVETTDLICNRLMIGSLIKE